MKSYRRLGWSNARVTTCMIAFGAVLFTGVTVQAAPQYDLACNSCHQMPPLDSPAGVRDPLTGSVVGNHGTHAGSTGATCVKCHGSEQTSTSHRDKVIQLPVNINGSPVPATYSRGVFFNQTSVTPSPMGSCSNVNCHFETVTPLWGSAKFVPATTTDCNKCHNYTSISTAAHTKHVAKFTCESCHSNHAAEASPFAHATSAGKRGIKVQFSAAPNNGTGSYVDTSTDYIDYLPSQTPKYGTCSTLYCHSSGQSATGTSATPDYVTPAWNGPSGTCGSCHKATAAELVTGSHSQHLATDSNCDYCHSGAYVATEYNSPSHINRLIEVTSSGYSAGGALGNGYGTCSTAICHGTITPLKTWGANNPGSHTCTKCHGTPTNAAFANISANRYVFAPATSATGDTGQVGTTRNSKVGAHQTHLRYLNGLSQQGAVDNRCSTCHGDLPTTNLHAVSMTTPSLGADPSGTFNGLATTSSKGTMSPLPVYGFYSTASVNKSCNNIYCHNPAGTGGTLAATNTGTSTRPTWVDAAYISEAPLKNDLNCNRCHKSPNGSNVISTKQNHAGFSIGTACTMCHGHEGSIGGAAGKQHMDGFLWGQGGSCNSCHGYEAVSWTAAPVINAEGKGAHDKHIAYLTTQRSSISLAPDTDQYAGGTTSWTNVCGVCHGNTATNHMNNAVTVAFDPNFVLGTGPATYAGVPGIPSATTPKTCSNIGCHSSGQSADGQSNVPVYAVPAWNGAAATCASCHASTALTTGSHAQHLPYNDNNCDNCHSGAYIASGYNSASHVNGQIEVTSNGYTKGGTPGNGYSGCSTAICHGSMTSPVWGANSPTGTDSCTKCHGTNTLSPIDSTNRYFVAPSAATSTDKGQVSTTNAKTGAHQTHLRFFNGLKKVGPGDDDCTTCHGPLPTDVLHTMNTIFEPSISDPTSTFNGLATHNGTMSPAPLFTTTTDRTCSNTYCHNPAAAIGGTLDPANAGKNIAPVWTDATYIDDAGKSLTNCQKCHLVPGSTNFTKQSAHGTMVTDTSANQCNGCHGHNGDAAGTTGQQHIDGIRYVNASGSSCDGCHDFDTVGATYTAGKWSGGTWGRAGTNYGAYPTMPEGWGAHAKHINYIKTRLVITAPLDAGGTFGAGDAANVCGSCHTNVVANHNTGGATGYAAGRTINFGDSTYKIGGTSGTSFVFSAASQVTNPLYNGTSGTSSAVANNNKTCSNISCHYFTTPLWSTY